MKKVILLFKGDLTAPKVYAVASVEYNILGLLRFKYENGDVEYINLDQVFSVKEIA